MANVFTIAMCTPHTPEHLPAYARTRSLHSGHQPTEIATRTMMLLDVVHCADHDLHNALSATMAQHGNHPADTGHLTPTQAQAVAQIARTPDQAGDTLAADTAELLLNAAGYLLQDLLPTRLRPSVARSIQADQEPHRMASLRALLAHAA